jgi:two-component system heavy metal sensor histidine kinase CusS
MPPVSVVLSLDIEHHMEFMAMFERAMWASVAIGILLTGLLGWFAAHRGLAPLRGIVELARGISASHLNQRLPLAAVPVELIDLVTEFNGMLARLEDSFKRLSDFSSDLAHELRTPVSNLMTQTQVALTQARSAEAYREVLYSSMEEYDRLARMIADMLFLAKADHGLIVPRREIVDLAVEIEELFEFYDALAEAQGVRLSTTGQAMVTGDKLMLRRALSNLISNAIRHTPRLGTVHVEIAMQASGGVHIGIANPGTPVSPEHLPHLFERFYRVDPSRQRSSEGAGLGLAITKSIILAHGGSITVHSDKESTRFDIRLPQAGGAIDAAAASLPH